MYRGPIDQGQRSVQPTRLPTGVDEAKLPATVATASRLPREGLLGSNSRGSCWTEKLERVFRNWEALNTSAEIEMKLWKVQKRLAHGFAGVRSEGVQITRKADGLFDAIRERPDGLLFGKQPRPGPHLAASCGRPERPVSRSPAGTRTHSIWWGARRTPLSAWASSVELCMG